MINVLMVDGNLNHLNVVSQYFNTNKKIKVVKHALTGTEALKIIEEDNDSIDVIVLDLILSGKDGFSIIEYVNKNFPNINIIVNTSYNEEKTIRRIADMGVSYLIIKPFDIDCLEKAIIDIMKLNKKNKISNLVHNDLQICITKILHNLGMPSHIKGYSYIREAITLLYDNPDLIGGITKTLYPMIAKTYESTPSRVERAIRHAIEVSWNRGNWDLMEEIFGHSVDIDKAKPTNSEFIVTISDKLRLEYRKNTQK